MLTVIRAHNAYKQPSGEDAVFGAEVRLLREHGVSVSTLEVSNDDIQLGRSLIPNLALGFSTIWSRIGRQKVTEAIEQQQPDLIHFDNTFPLLSPAVYSVARAAGVAVVQTLHNYRLLCPSASLYRNGQPCEDCLGKAFPAPGVIHACYRGSRLQTGTVAAMLATHNVRHTWTKDVDRYIALSEFSRSKFIEGGLPEGLISVKPNLVYATHQIRVEPAPSRHVLFVGRLSSEKGIETLLAAQQVGNFSLKIIGDGPLADVVRRHVDQNDQVVWLGTLEKDQVLREMRNAAALVFPSQWYETFGLVAIESFSQGTPVIGSNIGAIAELIRHGDTGLLFESGNPEDLSSRIQWLLDNPISAALMGDKARREFEAKYTPERNFEILASIYAEALRHVKTRTNHPARR